MSLRGGTVINLGNGQYVGWQGENSPEGFSVDSEGNITAGGTKTWDSIVKLTQNLGTSNLLDTLANFGSSLFNLGTSIINSETAKNATDLYGKISGSSNQLSQSSIAAEQSSLYENIANTVKRNQKMIVYGIGGLAAIMLYSKLKKRKA